MKDTYSVQTSLRQSVAALSRSRSLDSHSRFQEFLAKVRVDGDFHYSVGGGLFPRSWEGEGDITALAVDYTAASTRSVSEAFRQTMRMASQQIDAERSVVVSSFEDKEQIDVTARVLHNTNDCFAVTYFVRRVSEAYEMSTRVIDIDWLQALAGSHVSCMEQGDMGVSVSEPN
jgi:thermitase